MSKQLVPTPTSKVISLDAYKSEKDKLLSKVTIGKKLITGVDYIPPFTAQLQIISPFQNDSHHKSQLLASAIDINQTLPDKFAWHIPSTVKSSRMNDYNVKFISEPQNQLTCGSCWAVSSTTVFADRYGIANKVTAPELSYAVTVSCANASGNIDGCNGGFPAHAGCFFDEIGVPELSCWPYDLVCKDDPNFQCSTAHMPCCAQKSLAAGAISNIQDMKGEVAQCADFSSWNSSSCSKSPGNPKCCSNGCQTSDIKRYHTDPKSTTSLANGDLTDIIHRMKWNIFAGGPIVGAYFVYMDFVVPMLLANRWGWKQTGGIYVHSNPSPYIKDPFVTELFNYGKQKKTDDSQMNALINFLSNQMSVQNIIDISSDINDFQNKLNEVLMNTEGGHAVAITGWSIDSAGDLGNIPVWYIRNSWGSVWNEKGYFRMAMTNPEKNIDGCGIDLPITIQGTSFGGGTCFQVTPDEHKTTPTPTPTPTPSPSPTPSPTPSPKPYHPVTTKNIIVDLFIVSALVLFIVLLMKSLAKRR